jgi:hypothetical protein
VLHQQLRNTWHARKRVVPVSPVLTLTPKGLVLGSGTVLVLADGPRQLQSLRGQELRVLALLSAAYGYAIAPSVLGNIDRAAKAWNEGDDCLAYIHLAHAGLREPQDPYELARRLFIVEGFMKAGTSPRAVYEALHLGAAYINLLEKLYNPAQPRVPAGNGRTSGEWMRLVSALGSLTAAQVAELGTFALRLGGASAALGLLFVPSPNKVHVEGEVPELPGLRYSWNRDESLLHLTYDGPDGDRQTFTAQLQEDVFRDARGQVVGRVLSSGTLTIDPAAIFPNAANDDEPKLCPEPGPDRPGNEKGKDYEDYVKSIVNPENPTPRYWGFQLPNLGPTGGLVYFDDCEHSTGAMIETKDEYAWSLTFPQGMQSVAYDFLAESKRQVDAAGTRAVRWYFSEQETADFAKELFRDMDDGRETIKIVPQPWPGQKR